MSPQAAVRRLTDERIQAPPVSGNHAPTDLPRGVQQDEILRSNDDADLGLIDVGLEYDFARQKRTKQP